MSETALETILGIVFAIIGLALLIRLKKLSKSRYYRDIFIASAVLMIGFGIYLIIRSLELSF